MSVSCFEELRNHVGHNIVCCEYTDENNYIYNVALECEDCNEVLISYDNDTEIGDIKEDIT
jgi:hypothetical protein